MSARSDAALADLAPTALEITDYDRAHAITYMRLLDAAAQDADWREVTQIVLNIDPSLEPDRARLAWETHLARARWMTQNGYRHVLHSDGAV